MCGAGISILTALISSTALARAVFIGPLEPTLVLAMPTGYTSIIATSVRPATPVATTASPFAALSLLHSPSLGRRRRQKEERENKKVMGLFGGEKNTEQQTNKQRTDPESVGSTKGRKGREETRTNSSIGNFLETKRTTKLVVQNETPAKAGCRVGL